MTILNTKPDIRKRWLETDGEVSVGSALEEEELEESEEEEDEAEGNACMRGESTEPRGTAVD